MTASKHAVNEKQLFHGTNPEIVEAICKQNFDWRLHGKNATVYGEGSYFALNSSYSDDYAKEDVNLSKFMFVAKVLVGSYAVGQSSYRRPPQKDPGNPASDLYDSCVDDRWSPTIFVVFDDDQYYPEYIIEYSAVSRGYGQPATRAPVPRVQAAASQSQSSRTHTSSKPTTGLGTSLHSSGSTAAAAGYSYASNVPRYSTSTSSGPYSYSSGATNTSYHSTGSASAYTTGSNPYSSSSSRPSSSNPPARSTSPTGILGYSSPSSYTRTSSPYSSSASSSHSSMPRHSYPSTSETRQRSSKEPKCLIM